MVPARARRGLNPWKSPVPTMAHHSPATFLLSPGTPPRCLPPSPLPGVAPADGPWMLPSSGCIFPGAPCPQRRGMRGTRPRAPCLLLPGHPPPKNRPGLAGPPPAPRGRRVWEPPPPPATFLQQIMNLKKKGNWVSAVPKGCPSWQREPKVFLALNSCDFKANLLSESLVHRQGGAGQPPASLGYLLLPELPVKELYELRGNLLFSAFIVFVFFFFFFPSLGSNFTKPPNFSRKHDVGARRQQNLSRCYCNGEGKSSSV